MLSMQKPIYVVFAILGNLKLRSFCRLIKEKTWKRLDILDFLSFDANWISNCQLVGLNIFVSKCQLFELFNNFVDYLTYGTYVLTKVHPFLRSSAWFLLSFRKFFWFFIVFRCFLVFCHDFFCWYFWNCKWIAFLPSTWNNLKYLIFSNEQT